MQQRQQRPTAASSKQTTLKSNFNTIKGNKFYTPDKAMSKSGAASRAMKDKGIVDDENNLALKLKESVIQEYTKTFNTNGCRSAKRIQQIMGAASNNQDSTKKTCKSSDGKDSASSLFANSQTSATTACTMVTQRDHSIQNTCTRYGADFTGRKTKNLLQKRKAATPSDELEQMVKVLVNKKTNERKSFMLVDESKLKAQKQDNHEIYNYNMDKLEVEYDYDTDQEQVNLSRKHLETDFFEAVKFSVVECPMVLCGNLKDDIKNLKDKDFFN